MKTKKIILLTNVFVQLNLFIYQGTLFMSNNQHKKNINSDHKKVCMTNYSFTFIFDSSKIISH